MMLESMEHPYSCFITLTYNEEHVPKDGSVSKRPLQLFIKRVREAIHPRTLRYYACGEYGDKSWRPHYHALLFGVSPTEEKMLSKCWPFGFISVGTCEPESMSYVSGYVIKKMTSPKDQRLQGRAPEFCLMSRKPGLGFGAVARIVAAYQSERGKAALLKQGWITNAIRSYGYKYPLGRYLRTKVEEQLGLSLAAKTVYKEGIYRTIQEKHVGEDRTAQERRYQVTRSREEGRLKIRKPKML